MAYTTGMQNVFQTVKTAPPPWSRFEISPAFPSSSRRSGRPCGTGTSRVPDGSASEFVRGYLTYREIHSI
jgi:hypothetical protein